MSEPLQGLRILMTADTLGGVWDYSLELARHLARRGIETTLATMGRLPSPSQRQAAATVPGLHLEESSFGLEWMPETGAEELERAGDWLLSLERKVGPDIVHLNGYTHAVLPWRSPPLVVAHSCVLSWWLAVKGEQAPPFWDRYADRVRIGLHQAEVVVAPTEAFLCTLGELYGDLPHGQIIWNGRHPEAFPHGEKGRFIFSAGRLWDEAKNLAALTAAAPELPWPVIVAGDWRRPDGSGECPEQVECLGLLPTVQLANWLSRAPIYALPARYEPFGLSVLEAGLAGCALVLGDIPTLRELWDGVALFVPPDDHGKLRLTLNALIGDDRLRKVYGRAARERALNYTGERMAESYCQLYAELLGRRSGKAGTVPGRHPVAMKK